MFPKVSQDSNKMGRLRSESESNDVDETLKQCVVSESEDISHEPEETGPAPSDLPTITQQRGSNDDSNEVLSSSKHVNRELSASKKDFGSRKLVSDILSGATSDEKDSAERRMRKKNLKNKRRDVRNDSGTTKLTNPTLRKRSRSEKRTQRTKENSGSIEIPITEILRRTQEQRTKYEEPSPMSELTAKTMYVQGRNGFSAVKFSNAGMKYPQQSVGSNILTTNSKPLKIATAFQKMWNSCGLIIQGLLGGMAMLHLILLQSSMTNSSDLIHTYSNFSEIYTCLFSSFISLCIMSILDKFDLAHVSRDHIRRIFENHKRSILALPLYITAFSLHQFMAKIDDRLSLSGQNCTNFANSSSDEQEIFELSEIQSWQKMMLSKDALVALSWIIVATSDNTNMLLVNLESSNEYAESESPT